MYLKVHDSKQLRTDLLKRLFFAGQGIAGMRLVKVHDAVFINITTARRKASRIDTAPYRGEPCAAPGVLRLIAARAVQELQS